MAKKRRSVAVQTARSQDGDAKGPSRKQNYSCGIIVSRIKGEGWGGVILGVSNSRSAKAVIFRIVTIVRREYISGRAGRGSGR